MKESQADGASAEENRDGLIQILGEDSIGFWAILDQIMFYEQIVDELSVLGTTHSSGSGTEDDGIKQRKDAKALGVIGQKNHLNDESDFEEDKGDLFNFENDGKHVGGSGSEKGDAL